MIMIVKGYKVTSIGNYVKIVSTADEREKSILLK